MAEKRKYEMKPCVVAISRYPSHKASEVGEKAVEAFKKYPRDAIGSTYLFSLGNKTFDGFEIVSITETPEDKVWAEFDHQMQRQRVYDGIEGYESTVEIRAKFEQRE